MVFRFDWALWRPLKVNFTARPRRRTDGIILHVAVSEAASLHGWFSDPKAYASSHLYVRRDGKVEQYIDLDHISWASKDGDARCISVETQGGALGEWTDAQLKSLARIVRETSKHYGYPLRVMGSSRGERGVGYHLLGVPATKAQKEAGVSQTGGELWSGAVGKVCPGPDRVKQMGKVVALAGGREGEDELTPEQAKQLSTLVERVSALVDAVGKLRAWADLEAWSLNHSELPTLAGLEKARARTEETLDRIEKQLTGVSERLGRLEKAAGHDA